MKAIKTVLTMCAALFALSAYSQLNPSNLTAYTDVEATEIFDVLSDKKGNIWIAAQSGLMRYDGYDVVRYHPDSKDSTTLGDLLTYSLFEDSKGSIWIGGFDFISQYNPETETFINYSYAHLVGYPPGAQPIVSSIVEGRHGQIFFGVFSGMGFKGNHAVLNFDPEEKKIIRLEHPESIEIDDVYFMSADTAGQVLVSARSGGFIIGSDLEVKKFELPAGIKSDKAFEPTKYADRRGFVWIANTGSALWRSTPKLVNTKAGRWPNFFRDRRKDGSLNE